MPTPQVGMLDDRKPKLVRMPTQAWAWHPGRYACLEDALASGDCGQPSIASPTAGTPGSPPADTIAVRNNGTCDKTSASKRDRSNYSVYQAGQVE